MSVNMRLLILFIVSLGVMLFAGLYNPAPAHAAVNYTFSYNFANRYNTEQITYTFSGLDATTTYTWNVYTVSVDSGQPLQTFGAFTSTPDDRSGSPTDETFTFGGVDFSTPLGTITYPQGYVGPIAVLDSDGTMIGRHFIAELPTFITTQDSGWLDGSGNTAVGEKQVIGNTQFTGSCRNPVYNEINLDGWMHSFTPCGVTTIEDGWAVFHYQVDAAYDPSTDSDVIEFYRVPTSTVEFDIQLDQLIDFQQTAAFTPADYAIAFIIVNTSTRLLPFLDNTRCANAFTAGSNPCIANVAPGIFNYSRYDSSPAWVSDGESVWIVTQDPTLNEWGINAVSDQVGQDGPQTLRTTAVTEAVWDSYHGVQIVADGFSGFIDSTVYAFTTSRTFRYDVANTVASSVVVEWTNQAVSLNSGLATPAEMNFVVQDFYSIVAVPTFEENVTEVIGNVGLDTDSGRAALLMMILFIGMIGTAGFTALRANLFAYLIVWTGLGATFVLGGFGTLLVNTVFTIITIGMWVFAIMARGDDYEAA